MIDLKSAQNYYSDDQILDQKSVGAGFKGGSYRMD